jgi:hypothetical protein
LSVIGRCKLPHFFSLVHPRSVFLITIDFTLAPGSPGPNPPSVALFSLNQKFPNEFLDEIVTALGPLTYQWQNNPDTLQDHINEVNATALKHNSLKLI